MIIDFDLRLLVGLFVRNPSSFLKDYFIETESISQNVSQVEEREV